MPTMITDECINCGNCERECPNTAIYEGGASWELNGVQHAALAEDIYYIASSKCTDCVGFFDERQCAEVCPVDCCIPNPDVEESTEELLAKAKRLHPDKDLPDDASKWAGRHEMRDGVV